MPRLALCPLNVDCVIGKEEEDDTTIIKIYQICPINFVLRAALPMMSYCYVFGTDLPSSVTKHNRRYVKGVNGASVSSEEREVLPLINLTQVQLRVH